MTEKGRVKCAECTHLYALHNASGCRLGGCRCHQFAYEQSGADAAPTATDVEQLVVRDHASDRLLTLSILTGIQTAVLVVMLGAVLSARCAS